MQPLHAAATIYSIHNLAYQGVFDGGGIFITGLGREHYNPNELEHFGAMNLTKGALHHSTLLSTVSPTYAQRDPDRPLRQRPRRRARRAQRRPRRHPERHRRRRVEPRHRQAPGEEVRRQKTVRQGGLQGGAAKGGRLRDSSRRSALRRGRAADVAEGVRRPGPRARPHPGLGRADRAAGDRRSRRGALLRLGRRPPRRQVQGLAEVRQRPRAPHRGRLRLLPDAVPLRALRPEPDVQPPLRDAAHRPGDRRPRRHRPELRRGERRRHRLHVHRPQPRVARQHHRLGRLDLVRPPQAHRRR